MSVSLATGAVRPPVPDIDHLRARLSGLRLEHAAAGLGDLIATSVREDWCPPRLLDQVLAAESRAG